MKNFNISILGIIGILVLVVFASGCTSSDNSTMSNSSSSNGQSSQSNQPASSTSAGTVKVIASGGWSGDISDNSGSKTVQGTGSQTFQLSQDPGTVAIDFQKDNSKDAVNNETGAITPDTSTLTVQIVDGSGNVVATQSTSADAGVVSTSYTF